MCGVCVVCVCVVSVMFVVGGGAHLTLREMHTGSLTFERIFEKRRRLD